MFMMINDNFVYFFLKFHIKSSKFCDLGVIFYDFGGLNILLTTRYHVTILTRCYRNSVSYLITLHSLNMLKNKTMSIEVRQFTMIWIKCTNAA